ncbi:hypothetical protein COB64_04150 [Candidatus Wolfebacteria bacterium]|nr:MAG: hypothetical protein COB64_04150 [Candidatus Wolfebacteria bacterium]
MKTGKNISRLICIFLNELRIVHSSLEAASSDEAKFNELHKLGDFLYRINDKKGICPSLISFFKDLSARISQEDIAKKIVRCKDHLIQVKAMLIEFNSAAEPQKNVYLTRTYPTFVQYFRMVGVEKDTDVLELYDGIVGKIDEMITFTESVHDKFTSLRSNNNIDHVIIAMNFDEALCQN